MIGHFILYGTFVCFVVVVVVCIHTSPLRRTASSVPAKRTLPKTIAEENK